jgi:hypothetical protein
MPMNDGGFAFPGVPYASDKLKGMSLWDFYAAMDLPVSEQGDWLGWFGAETTCDAFGKLPPDATGLDKMKWLATVEAKIRALRADAMIAEREKRRANQPIA